VRVPASRARASDHRRGGRGTTSEGGRAPAAGTQGRQVGRQARAIGRERARRRSRTASANIPRRRRRPLRTRGRARRPPPRAPKQTRYCCRCCCWLHALVLGPVHRGRREGPDPCRLGCGSPQILPARRPSGSPRRLRRRWAGGTAAWRKRAGAGGRVGGSARGEGAAVAAGEGERATGGGSEGRRGEQNRALRCGAGGLIEEPLAIMRFRAEPWVDRSRPSGPGQRALCPDPGLQCCRSPRGWRDTHLGGLDGGDLAEKRGSSAKGGRRENPGKQPAVARRWISSARPRLECRRVGDAPGLTLAVQRPRPGAVPVDLGGGETGQPSVFGRVDRERGGGGSEGGAHLEPVAGCCEELCWCWTVVPSRTRCAGGERGA